MSKDYFGGSVSALRSGVLSVALIFLAGCGGLIPQELQYQMHLDPILPEGRGDYYIDEEDTSVVFSKEGALVKVKPVTDAELNRQYPRLFDGRHVNPYTHEKKDIAKGYIPPRFTVFQVTVINKTYAKIQFDPAKTILVTDKGEEFRYYDPGRAGEGVDPLGGNRFNEYYKSELGRSGLDKDLNLERMGLIYKSAYHRFRSIFKEDQRTGKVAFDPLPEETEGITLKINDFVLSFDANGNPQSTTDFEFRFGVDQGAIKLEKAPNGSN